MHAVTLTQNSSMPNRQMKYISIETPEKNCTKQTRQYGTVKPAYNGPPMYRKSGQTENKFRNGVISHVK